MNGRNRLIADIIFLLLLCLLCLSCSVGYTMTATATNQYITIPTQQWNELKSEFQELNSELIQCQDDLRKLKKPSQTLVEELNQAQLLQKKLQQELTEQKKDLILLSNDAEELRTSLQTLKEQINKERRTHKRQVWQNRLWCLLIGVGVGCAVK